MVEGAPEIEDGMTFVAQLVGHHETLAVLARCFQGDFARIRKAGDFWLLESIAFNECKALKDVLPVAKDIVYLINQIWALYIGHIAPVSVGYLDLLDDNGATINRFLHSSQEILIYHPKDLEDLRTLHDEETLGSILVKRAVAAPDIRASLILLGDRYLQWPQIYDIIEFLGGIKQISAKHWATAAEVRRFRQTANHYRHLGSPKRNPLPPSPPTLDEARVFAKTLLKRWLAMKGTEGTKR
jgi:hypothetical protein